MAMGTELEAQYATGEEALSAEEAQLRIEQRAAEAVSELDLSGAATLRALIGVCQRFTETLQNEVEKVDVTKDARSLKEGYEIKVHGWPH